MKVLVLNSGSSTQKSALFELERGSPPDAIPPLWEGKIEWDGTHQTLTIKNSQGKKIQSETTVSAEDRHRSLERLLESAWNGPTAVISGAKEISVAGHRIVHGGPKLTQPVKIDTTVKSAIADVSAIAPLHNAAGLQGIELVEKLLPGVPQVAVFDTGFHRTLPQEAQVYPGPYGWYENGIRRYGFHGINHEYCAHRASRMLARDLASLKIVTCHLGNGCSLCAIDGGKSVDTTMGFTPLEGLMMGTRSGSVDPGILVHLIRSEKMSGGEIDKVLNHESGLLGISGVSSDMRDVLEAAKKNSRAKLAFEVFVHRLQSGIGAMAASLGGMDALVFTAGIGENSPEVRASTCEKLKFLGVSVDTAKNSAPKPDCDISTPDSHARILVIRAQEDWAIARECVKLV